MKIKYEFLTGQAVEIEVEGELAGIILQMNREQYNSDRRETRRHESYSGDNDKQETLLDISVDVEQSAIRHFEHDELRRAIKQLLPQQQELIRKIYFEEQKIVEIARCEGVSESAILDRLRKVHKKLEKLLR